MLARHKTVQKRQVTLLLWKRSYLKMSRVFPQLHFNVQKAKPDDDKAKKNSFHLMQQAKLLQGASSGTFYLLPLLTRSLEKLYRLIDQEMQGIGAQKITMPCLAPAALWETTNRWEEMGSELFRLTDRRGSKYCLAPTHEEAVTTLVKNLQTNVSYKQLPIKLYQIGRKFRDEMRPKNGLLRCREFDMKDLYTFDADSESAKQTYDQVISAYKNIFNRLNVAYHQVEASTGAMGGESSHEFHIVSSMGEDTLCKCSNCGHVYNQELMTVKDGFSCKNCQSAECEKYSGVEIAHCFILGTKYSSVLEATFRDKELRDVPYYMGCYGIGVSRLLAAVMEDLGANKLRWPRLIAPHQVIILPMQKGYKSEESFALAENVSEKLSSMPNLRNEVILDDRLNMSIGKKLGVARQVGIPYAVILGKKSLEEAPLFEFVDLYNDKTEFYTEGKVVKQLSKLETL